MRSACGRAAGLCDQPAGRAAGLLRARPRARHDGGRNRFDESRSASRSGGRASLSSLHGARRPLPSAVSRRVLRGLRTLLRARGAVTGRARSTSVRPRSSRKRTGSSAFRATRKRCFVRSKAIGFACCRTNARTKRSRSCSRGSTTSASRARRIAPAASHRSAGRCDPGRVRMVRRARELPRRIRLRGSRKRLWMATRGAANSRPRQRRAALSCRLLGGNPLVRRSSALGKGNTPAPWVRSRPAKKRQDPPAPPEQRG